MTFPYWVFEVFPPETKRHYRISKGTLFKLLQFTDIALNNSTIRIWIYLEVYRSKRKSSVFLQILCYFVQSTSQINNLHFSLVFDFFQLICYYTMRKWVLRFQWLLLFALFMVIYEFLWIIAGSSVYSINVRGKYPLMCFFYYWLGILFRNIVFWPFPTRKFIK